LYKDGFASLALDQVHSVETCWIDITDDNFRNTLRKEQRRRATNPPTPASDKRDPTCETEWSFAHIETQFQTELSFVIVLVLEICPENIQRDGRGRERGRFHYILHSTGCGSGNLDVRFRFSASETTLITRPKLRLLHWLTLK
jgi:hypothetical protein